MYRVVDQRGSVRRLTGPCTYTQEAAGLWGVSAICEETGERLILAQYASREDAVAAVRAVNAGKRRQEHINIPVLS